MNLSDHDRKVLWTKAGNRCSFRHRAEICRQTLVLESGTANAIVGDECHIVGCKPGSARHVDDCPDRESYDNAILLCGTHHTLVDADDARFTVGMLKEMKAAHEAAVGAEVGSVLDRVDFVDSQFTTEVDGAERAVGMEVTKPASFTNVKSTLKATNVQEAVGFSTTQPMTGALVSCSHCGRLSPAAYTGPKPRSVRGASCGGDIPLH